MGVWDTVRPAIELEPISGKQAFDAFREGYEKNLLARSIGDILALSPSLVI